MASVLVVDEHREFRLSLAAALKQQGHQVHEASSGRSALKKLAINGFDLVITDLKMADTSGMDILKSAKERDPRTEVMVITSYGSIESAVAAMKNGAIDFVSKPLNSDQLLIALRKALERKELLAEVRLLRQKVRDKFELSGIVARSPKMRELLSLLPQMATSSSPVLILGETGTGKELVAKALHSESFLSDKPFVTVNCAALPESLLESELFGHVRGAFTGAFYAKKGMLVEADGGTIFLDEIAELPLSTQSKLLRFLECGDIKPLGDNRTIKVNARVLAATNQELEEALRSKRFREDLYYRLNVLQIKLPPLRERKEDIPALVDYFIRFFQTSLGRKEVVFAREAVEVLMRFSWPGNVRQLRNVMERALVMNREKKVIGKRDLQLPDEKPGAYPTANELLPLTEVEKRHILARLKHCGGNQSKAARLLGISKITLWRKLKEYGVNPKSFQT